MTSFRPRPFRLSAASAAACALLALAGCSAGDARARVTPPPAPPADVAQLCAALHEELPAEVSGEERRDTEPASGLTAAWGGAAIVLRCGVPRPPEMSDPKAEGVEVDGVGWLVQSLNGGGKRFTTTYRTAYVEVSVAAGAAGGMPAGALTYFAGPVKEAVPSTL
ncbi:DUF3515 domain-containing protein [Streptomyces sp. NPDC097619]|uniref:DUF3515 domain-containing protein n=1 Tax=Streptomyces sp. NPDC097619 TaxID=3157228 RepID=UPI00332A1C7F